MNIYSHKKISDRVFIIREGYTEKNGLTIGLIVGDDKAAVVDSGMGVFDGLREYIEKLTCKELICIVTHAHPDHAGGAVQFDTVYMNERDNWILEWALPIEKRMNDLDVFSEKNLELRKYAQEHYVDCSDYGYINLEDGDSLDLGNVILEIIKLPGHSPGSLAVYHSDEKIAFTSDAIIPNIVLSDENHQGIIDCRDSLDRFLQMIDPSTTLYCGHLQEPLPISLASDLKAAYTEIIEDRTEKDEMTYFQFAEEAHPGIRLKLHKYKSVSVTYNADLYNK